MLDLSLPPVAAGDLRHAIGIYSKDDGLQLRSLIAFEWPDGVPEGATASAMLDNYRPITATSQICSVLKVNPLSNKFLLAEARHCVSASADPGDRDVQNVGAHVWQSLRPLIDIMPQFSGHLSIIAPALPRDEFLPLLPSLASYALMFYVSSIVRYRPYFLYSDANGLERWILLSYVEQATDRLLMSALNGIVGVNHIFGRGVPAYLGWVE